MALAAPLVVNIDAPSFRKVVTAVPAFHASSPDAETTSLASSGAPELGRLLTFSSIFNVMDDAAFKDLVKDKKETWYEKDDLKSLGMPAWKTLGVESLTLATVKKEGTLFTLVIRTIDIGRGELVLGKKYSQIQKDQFPLVLRRYGDALLRAYTGKSGIFNSRLVFVGRTAASAAKQIYVADFDGSNAKPITTGNYPHISPTWSRDGKFVTFTSFRDGSPDLYIYEMANGKMRKLAGYKGINSGSNWAANGKAIAFTGSNSSDTDIYLTKSSGGDRKLFISGQGIDVDPTFSPDGKKIAFVSGRFGNPHIFVADLTWTGDMDAKVLGDKRLTYAGWWNATPAWSPEGDRIAFAGFDKEINRFDLFIMNPDGSKLERLTLKAGDNERPSFSPNGQNIIFHSNRTGGQDVKGIAQIYIMNRDGANQRQLQTGLYEAQTPIWGPNLGDD
jgi:TolB protein